MNITLNKLIAKIVSEKYLNILFSIFFGWTMTLLLKAKVFPFLLFSKIFDGDNLFLQNALLICYFVIFVGIYILGNWVLQRLISLTKPLWIKFTPQVQKEQSEKILFVALITIAIGVLVIFVINNLFIRFDTNNWQLKGLNIIPAEEPIGNDFRVGLYWPAQNLVKSGFKAIGPDGTYPSIYPPL
ncbi:MAG: hypothetical protein C0410_09730, partial [Anaerolinea sp.]|nr:hypothetical protein [Anaerolinea sp.]